jgi:hypothetical protein
VRNVGDESGLGEYPCQYLPYVGTEDDTVATLVQKGENSPSPGYFQSTSNPNPVSPSMIGDELDRSHLEAMETLQSLGVGPSRPAHIPQAGSTSPATSSPTRAGYVSPGYQGMGLATSPTSATASISPSHPLPTRPVRRGASSRSSHAHAHGSLTRNRTDSSSLSLFESEPSSTTATPGHGHLSPSTSAHSSSAGLVGSVPSSAGATISHSHSTATSAGLASTIAAASGSGVSAAAGGGASAGKTGRHIFHARKACNECKRRRGRCEREGDEGPCKWCAERGVDVSSSPYGLFSTVTDELF